MSDNQSDFFGALPGKTSFIFGLVSGIALLAILGMVFMLSSRSSSETGTSAQANTRPLAAAPTPSIAPTPTPPPAARPPAGNPPPVTEDDHIRGDVNAPITLIEYSDYECPFCKRFHPTMQQMMDEYGDSGQVRWVYRHFPLSFHRPLAMKQAEAVECANELGGNNAFWELSDRIFEVTRSNGNGMQESQLGELATEAGLNQTDFQTCLDSGKYAAHVEADLAGGSAAGVTGTPGSFLIDADGNAQLISGAVPYGQIKAAIDASL